MLLQCWSRRQLLAAVASVASVTSPGSLGTLAPAFAAEGGAVSLLGDPAFSFELAYPTGWEAAPKPVKTHQMESILKGPLHKAQLGLTVDPVKIGSLEEFGTLEQVTERVLAVEETRDGVQAVELRRAAAEKGSPTYYIIEYAVASSRGKKMYLCKYCIANKRLYVLQTQAALDSYEANSDGIRSQLEEAVSSFHVTTRA